MGSWLAETESILPNSTSTLRIFSDVRSAIILGTGGGFPLTDVLRLTASVDYVKLPGSLGAPEELAHALAAGIGLTAR